MQIKFTLNINEVLEPENGDLIDTEEEHYAQAATAFIEEMKDTEQELVLPDNTVIHYEMEDIEVVK
ncbi:MAG: hypothetical protein AB7V18_19355 [Pyrinomonadaceae bacterium]